MHLLLGNALRIWGELQGEPAQFLIGQAITSSNAGLGLDVGKKIDVENNGVSPDNGKTRLNPTNAHTQGVSGAAGSRFLFFST